MIKSSHQSYGIKYYRALSSPENWTDDFAPSFQSLKSAQDIVNRYEQRRRAAARIARHRRGAVTAPLLHVGAFVRDNIIPFRGPAAGRASSKPLLSGPSSQTCVSSSPSYARRASLHRQVRGRSSDVRISAPSPIEALDTVRFDNLQSYALGHFGVMAIQALAVTFGLSALLVLLTLL